MIYDIFRIIRKIIKHNGFFIAIQDIIYWVVCSILVFNMMYEYNNGIIRAFAVLAIVIGMLLYHGSVSDMIVDGISMVINKGLHLVNVVIGTVLNTVLWPFKFIFKKIKRFILFIAKKVRKLVLALIKPLKIKKKKVKMELSENQEDN